MKRRRFWWQQVWLPLLGVVLILPTLPGCRPGPPVGEVTGRVTIDGRPAPGLLVHFEPQDGLANGLPATYGATDEQGSYRAKRMNGQTGAALGLNHVRITAIERDGNQQAKIHARYAQDYTLWFDVAPGQNTFDLELRSDPLKRPKPAAAAAAEPAEADAEPAAQ